MNRSTYRALVARGDRKVALEKKTMSGPATNELLVRPSFVGICGTDLEIIDGRIDSEFIRYPIVLGHEWSALIEHDPSGTIEPGVHVVVEGIVPCGTCANCLRGKTNLCETYEEIGFTRDGGLSEYAIVPARLVHPLRKSISLATAALVEPSSVVLTGLQKARVGSEIEALIIGDGPIALLSVYLLRLWAPKKVVVLGRNEKQEGLARRAGASEFISDANDIAGKFDIIIEAAGSSDAVGIAVHRLRRGGMLLLLGIPPHGELAHFPVDSVVNNDLSIIGSFGYTAGAWKEVMRLLNSGDFDPAFLVTHVFSLDQWQLALELLHTSEEPRGKVLISPNAPDLAQPIPDDPAPPKHALQRSKKLNELGTEEL